MEAIDLNENNPDTSSNDSNLRKPNLPEKQEKTILSNDKMHALKNIIQGIIGYAEILMVTPNLPGQVYNDVHMVYELGLDAIGMIRQLPKSAKKSKYEYERTDLLQIVNDVASAVAVELGEAVDIKIENEGGEYSIDLDRSSFKRSLIDIILYVYRSNPNAASFSISLSPVMIDVSDHEGPDEPPPENWIEIRITSFQDNGTKTEQLPLEMLIASKDRFLDVVEPTLIGSYQSIRRHGGHAFRLGEEENITGFAILIPKPGGPTKEGIDLEKSDETHSSTEEETEARTETSVEEPTKMEESKTKRPAILVVDDDNVVLTVVIGMLEQLGYHAIRATTADEALMRFDEELDHITLVLLDVVMPKMDGLELLSALKEIDSSVPVILMTGYFSDIPEEELAELEISGWIEKPMNITRLEHTIENALKKE